jgi:hypothetical protein
MVWFIRCLVVVDVVSGVSGVHKKDSFFTGNGWLDLLHSFTIVLQMAVFSVDKKSQL